MLLGSISNGSAFQAGQQQNVTGTIIDSETGETLPGVNILVKNTNIGTVSDLDGSYSLNVAGPNAVLGA